MDNLTHSLTGLFLSRAGLNRFAPDATPILLIAANAPDIDVVSFFGGPAAVLHWHRNFTHSLFFSPLMAAVSVLLVRAFTRGRRQWVGAIVIAWLAVVSHLVLDLTNDYGVRLWEPFSGEWLHWDITFVADPILWVVLLLALFVPLVGRLLSSEMGQARRAYPPRGWAIFALTFFLLYDCGRAVLHARAVSTLDARMYAGEAPIRVAAFATVLNPLVWDGIAETASRDSLYQFNLLDEFDPATPLYFHRGSPGDALEALKNDRDFAALVEFAQYPLWRVVNDEYNSRYYLTDLRFGDPLTQTMTCSARLIANQSASGVADVRCNFSFTPTFTRLQ
jgi:inner membrane protein